jgi:AcrR family transcriptional regulator
MDVVTAPPASRRRDAAATRQLLLDAARHRFAGQGYAATTVREIADDAGVNVALISRYFASKEGLFEACLTRVSSDLGRAVPPGASLDEVVDVIAEQIAGPYTAEHPNQLALLLRTSGDDRAERIRLRTLQRYTAGLVAVAGSPGQDGDELVLRAQLALCAALGIALLRSATALEPLASATSAELVAPVRALITALLDPGATGR